MLARGGRVAARPSAPPQSRLGTSPISPHRSLHLARAPSVSAAPFTQRVAVAVRPLASPLGRTQGPNRVVAPSVSRRQLSSLRAALHHTALRTAAVAFLVPPPPHRRNARRFMSTGSAPDMQAAYNSAASDPSASAPKTPPPLSFAKDTTSWSESRSRSYSCPGFEGGGKLAKVLHIAAWPFRFALKVGAWCAVLTLAYVALSFVVFIILAVVVVIYEYVTEHFGSKDDAPQAAAAPAANAAPKPTTQAVSPVTPAPAASVAKSAPSPASSVRTASTPPPPPPPAVARGSIAGAAESVAAVARSLGL